MLRGATATYRSFSTTSTTMAATSVQKLGVVGAGQMVIDATDF